MKKKNFLSGVGAKLALAVVALTSTVLTSCEEENFGVTFEPNPAVVYINPTVIDAATNKNVTDKATFEPTSLTITGDKDIAEQTITVKATVEGVTGEATVNVAAVKAGTVVSYSPVILLSSKFNYAAVEGSAVKDPSAVKTIIGTAATSKSINHNGTEYQENATEYLINFTASWNLTRTATLVSKEGINIPSVDLEQAMKEGFEVKNEGSTKLQASAWSMYTAEYTLQGYNVKYEITSKASGESVGSATFLNPIYEVTAVTKEQAHPSHAGHYQHGHGVHGDGSNAGGGIVVAD